MTLNQPLPLDKRRNITQSSALFLASFITAILLITFLTSELKIRPNEIGATGENFFFNADVPVYVEKVRNTEWKEISSKHVLRHIIWIPSARLLGGFYDTGTDYEKSLYGVILLNKICIALGISLLTLFAFYRTGSFSKVTVFFLLTVLSSATVVMIAPDHFAQSFLLLTLSFLVLFLNISFGSQVVIQGILGVLIAGTTTTNAIFSGIIFLYLLNKKNWLPAKWYYTCFLLGLVCLIGACYFFYVNYSLSHNEDLMFNRFFNFQLFTSPFASIESFFATFSYPISAPPPLIKPPILSYEPISLLQLNIAELLITALVLFAVFNGIFCAAQNWGIPLLVAALAWVIFNFIFHNIWGDEYMLYTPHYSFMILLFFSAFLQKCSTKVMIGVCLPIVVYQSVNIAKIITLVESV